MVHLKFLERNQIHLQIIALKAKKNIIKKQNIVHELVRPYQIMDDWTEKVSAFLAKGNVMKCNLI